MANRWMACAALINIVEKTVKGNIIPLVQIADPISLIIFNHLLIS